MRYFLNIIFILFCMLMVSGLSIADKSKENHHLTPYSGTPEFERMKNLVGTWKGTMKMGEQEQEITVIYSTSSAGSVIIEKSFPGSPQEMVSVYYDKDGKLTMTHFCALKNQPQMTIADSKENRIDLAFSGGSNIDLEKDMYMHSLSIDFEDNNTIVHNWTQYDGGKEKSVSSYKLSRAN
ncbi:MAG: hypothetical protein ACR2NC_04240 [Thermodesulfobacteriota bacterium]